MAFIWPTATVPIGHFLWLPISSTRLWSFPSSLSLSLSLSRSPSLRLSLTYCLLIWCTFILCLSCLLSTLVLLVYPPNPTLGLRSIPPFGLCPCVPPDLILSILLAMHYKLMIHEKFVIVYSFISFSDKEHNNWCHQPHSWGIPTSLSVCATFGWKALSLPFWYADISPGHNYCQRWLKIDTYNSICHCLLISIVFMQSSQ
jgi:hypothetical protein